MARVAIAAAAASAALLWASSPAVGIGWVVWIALVPAAYVALRDRASRWTRLAVPLAFALYLELLLVPALPFGLTDGQWGDSALPVVVAGTPGPVVWLLAIPLLGALLYAIGFGRPLRAPRAPDWLAGLLAVFVPAAMWTLLELVRLRFDPAGLWSPLFLSQSGSAGAGLAVLGGPLLVTFVIVGFNYALAWTLARRRAGIALTAAAAGIAVLAGAALLQSPRDARPLTVAAIQPGYDTAEEERPELRFFEPGTYDLAAFDTIRDLSGPTRDAARDGAELIAWPEASMYVDPRVAPPVRRELKRLAAEVGATIVVPYFDRDARLSAVVAVPPDGAITPAQPKQRPMWFLGESADAAPARPLAAGGLDPGTLLGVDAQDSAIAAELARQDAELIVAAAHDWPALATQQRAMAAITARATGSPVVRADWRYGSAIYDRDGQELAGAGDDLRRSRLVATVEAAAPTPYTRVGNAIVLTVVGLALLAAGATWVAAPPRPLGWSASGAGAPSSS